MYFCFPDHYAISKLLHISPSLLLNRLLSPCLSPKSSFLPCGTVLKFFTECSLGPLALKEPWLTLENSTSPPSLSEKLHILSIMHAARMMRTCPFPYLALPIWTMDLPCLCKNIAQRSCLYTPSYSSLWLTSILLPVFIKD